MACTPNTACRLHMHNLCGFLLHTQHFLYTLGNETLQITSQSHITLVDLLIRYFFSCRLNYNCTVTERFWRTIVAIGCIVTALLVTYSRVYLLYHSNTQVIWGALIGITLGSAWFIIMHMILTPFFPIVVSWWVSGNDIIMVIMAAFSREKFRNCSKIL